MLFISMTNVLGFTPVGKFADDSKERAECLQLYR